jgi:hypothetical protein
MSKQFSGFAVAGGLLLLAVGGAVLLQRPVESEDANLWMSA